MTGQSLSVREPMALTPSEVVENASNQARILMDIVEKTGCFQLIAKKKYLQVEAWETIGAFNQTHAVTDSIRPILKENEIIGYEANVKLWKGSMIVGGATMPCFFTENACQGKEGDAKHKASMSAAQTFATSKAYRMNFSYVAILAGYEPTPAEEITGEDSLGGVKRDAKTEHWCAEHKTEFFKRGKMPGYAHPIEGTKDWHNEPEPQLNVTEAQNKPVEAESSSSGRGIEATGDKVSPIDMDWLTETLKIINWKEATAKSWLVAQFKVKTLPQLADMLDELPGDKLKIFANHMTAMRDASGQ